MTGSQKQEALVSVDILLEAHNEIKRAMEQGNSALAQSMLAECQEVAVALGGYIEKLEGEGNAVIPCLEEYCEVLFQIYEELNSPFYENKIYKRLKKQLIKVENSIKNDINARTEIVFFPYKASMWDSLESVYLAAKADSDCDVFCVPIPYYDLKPDQSLGYMHYEAGEYPDYVEITDWQAYDFESRKPDVAYIHNPYDNYNLVTSVHPRYYSETLKKYVKTLVYIPYNVTGGTLGKMHRLLPSYFNMDQIIVQNERQISFFIPEISHKVSALGSPKFDKVINSVITEEMIPDEWKPRMRDVILFLNTGINGLLKHNEKSLLKIQYIVEVAEKENATVLWRPHPLLEATIRSMRPELWELYLETLEKFYKYENGILDRTGNPELAIGISSAYVGEDTSSISHMFGVLGKPVFFIRQGILEEKEDVENIKLSCCTSDAKDRDFIWASAAGRNGLLKISKQGVIEEFYIIPNEKDRSNLYSDILAYGKKLYLIPRNAREIAIFDIESKQFDKIALPSQGKKEKFNKGYLYAHTIYLIPRLYEKMAVLSCDDGNLSYNTDIVNELKEITGIPDIYVSANGSQLIGDSIYLAAPNKPYVLEYDLKRQETRVHKILGAEYGFSCMEKVSGKIVLGSLGGSELTVWDPAHGTFDVISEFPKGWSTEEEICFWDIVEMEGDAYIFPRKNPMVLKLSLENLSLTPVKKPFPFSIEKRKSSFFNHPDHFLLVKKLADGNVVVQDANRHGISEFFTDGTFKWKQIALTEKDELRVFRESFSKQGGNLPWGIYETKYHSVRRLILYIRQKLHDKKRQKEAFSNVAENLDGTAGQKIHAFIKEISGKK